MQQSLLLTHLQDAYPGMCFSGAKPFYYCGYIQQWPWFNTG